MKTKSAHCVWWCAGDLLGRGYWGVIFALAALLVGSVSAWACPFCSVEQQTLSEETQSADAVVLAKLIKEAPNTEEGVIGSPDDPDSGMATFEIVEVLRGKELLKDTKELKAVYFGEPNRERTFMINGLGTEKLDWTTPLPLSPAAVEYARKLPTVPASGPDRIAFFQEYLEHEDPLLAQDAYDEFARAPYADIHLLAPRMHHDRLVNWITSPDTSPSRRRLYLTMLGTCGSKDDLPMLESQIVTDYTEIEPRLKELIDVGLAVGGPIGLPNWLQIVEQDERRKKLGLDALVACYLTLRGPDGLDLIDERFLKNPKADYTYIYSTIMALRFHGDQETGVLPKDRLLSSMRLLLDNKDFADQVILDLSRWEDWSVIDRLVELFKVDDGANYARQPVVTYLTVASEQPGEIGQKAAASLAELERLDPDTVKQARSLMAFGALGRARASAAAAAEGKDATTTEGKVDSAADAGAFAASAADEATDTSDMPDPAAFEERKDASATAEAEPPAEAGPAPAAVASDTAKGRHVVAKTAVPAPGVTTAEVAPSEVNPAVIIGVPLLGALLLMGLYWVILRAGAV